MARHSSSGTDQPQPGEPARAAPQGAAAFGLRRPTIGRAIGLSVAVCAGVTPLLMAGSALAALASARLIAASLASDG